MKHLIKKIFPALLLALLAVQPAKAQYFADYELSSIKIFVDTLLVKLDQYSDFTTDGQQFSMDYQQYFTDLFLDPVTSQVYNDITEKPKYISAFDYSNLAQKLFPSGLSVRYIVDSAKISNPQKLDDSTFYLYVTVPKYMAGLTAKNQIVFRHYTAYIKVVFNFDNHYRAFSNFVIDEIRNYKDILKQNSDRRSRGLYLAFDLNGLGNQFVLPQAFTQEYTRYASISPGFKGGMQLTYKLNSNLGFSLGASYLFYQSSADVSYQNLDNTTLMIDQDSDSYYLYVNGNVTERLLEKSLLIPFSLTYRSGLSNQTGFFFIIGLTAKYTISSQMLVSGKTERSGYYPEYHLLIDNAPDYGFGTFSYSDKYTTGFNKLVFFGTAAAGISIPFNNLNFINLSVNYFQSFSSLGYNNAIYLDDYYSHVGKPAFAFLQSFGFSISYMFKL